MEIQSMSIRPCSTASVNPSTLPVTDTLGPSLVDMGTKICEICKCKTNKWNSPVSSGKGVICNTCVTSSSWKKSKGEGVSKGIAAPAGGSKLYNLEIPLFGEGGDSASGEERMHSPGQCHSAHLSPLVYATDEAYVPMQIENHHPSGLGSSANRRVSKRKRSVDNNNQKSKSNVPEKRRKVSTRSSLRTKSVETNTNVSSNKDSLNDKKLEKDRYYCKYCDTSWPYSHFRNAQQFGAHCSNCSRKRKVKDPQEMTIRERNKRLRKNKVTKSSSKREQGKVKNDTNNFESNSSDLDDSAEDEDNLDVIKDKDHLKSSEIEEEEEVDIDHYSPSETPTILSPNANNTATASTSSSSSSPTAVNNKLNYKIQIPEKQIPQQDIINDPYSLGGLLMAMEQQISTEQTKQQMDKVKDQITGLMNLLNEGNENSFNKLKLKSKIILQGLDVSMSTKIESLKLEFSSEIAFRERTRRIQLEDLKRQIVLLEGVLKKNYHRHSGNNHPNCFTSAENELEKLIMEIENLKIKMKGEFKNREQIVDNKFIEIEKDCVAHLDKLKDRLGRELDFSEKDASWEKEIGDLNVRVRRLENNNGSNVKPNMNVNCMDVGADNQARNDFEHFIFKSRFAQHGAM